MPASRAVEESYGSVGGRTVASQVASLPPLSVLLGGGAPIAKPPIPVDGSREVVPEAITGVSAGHEEDDFVNETTVWKQIEKSLNLPALYRSREDLTLTLRMLRRIHYLKGLNEDDLMTIANGMRIETISTQGFVVWEKTEPEPEVADSDSESENEMDEMDRLLLGIGSKKSPQRKADSNRLPQVDTSSSLNKVVSPSSSRFRSPGLEDHSMISAVSSLPPVSYSDQPVHFLARGKILLEIPTVNGMQHYPVLPLDTFGNELWTEALPVGSKYLSTEPCTLVVLQPGDQKLNRVLARVDKMRLEEQKRFLRDQLKVKIFESWQEAEFERCAKCFVPLRVESFQIVMEEGERSDCLYFLKEGQLTVTRLVRPHPKKKSRSKHAPQHPQHQSAMDNLVRHVRDPTLAPTEHVMQVASLNPGEFFGELGLLAHDPDVRPGENIVWTDKYWTNALCNRFKQTDVVAEASFVKELCGGGRGSDQAGTGSSSGAASGDGTSLPRPDANEHIDIRYPPVTTNRMATVYAQLPSMLYRLSFEHCREHIGGIALTRLMEFVKGYPAHDEIYEQFEKQLKWTVYRDEFIAEVLRQNKKKSSAEHLPNLKI